MNRNPKEKLARIEIRVKSKDKRRYGKLGGNVAYHGYQSFISGEVTPEEAHQIGLETARRMWARIMR